MMNWHRHSHYVPSRITEDTGKDPSDTETSELIGTKYIRKRSRSEGDIQQDMSSDIHDMVSKNAYGKHRTTKSLDELTLNRIFPTYEYAYVTAVCAETETDDKKTNLPLLCMIP